VFNDFKNTTHDSYHDDIIKNDNYNQPIPVVTLSKVWVGGRSFVAVRIPRVTWISVAYDCCVLPGRGFCLGLITRPEES